jgi:hypothetical protein
MTNTATITLTNAHGTFQVDAPRLTEVAIRLREMSTPRLRRYAAGLNGFPNEDAYDGDTRFEVLIMVTEGGNI